MRRCRTERSPTHPPPPPGARRAGASERTPPGGAVRDAGARARRRRRGAARGFRRVLRRSAFILGDEVGALRGRLGGGLRDDRLRRRGVRDRGPLAHAPCGGHRPRRRGDRSRAHIHRLGAGRDPCRRRAGPVRRRGRHRPARRRRRGRCHRPAHGRDPGRAPLRPAVRHARLARLAARHGLALFEDAAQAHGADVRRAARRRVRDGRRPSRSTRARTSARSGDGGAICTNDSELAERARRLRNLGQRRKGEHVVPGVNERLDGLQAALATREAPRARGGNAARAAARRRLPRRVGGPGRPARGAAGDAVRLPPLPRARGRTRPPWRRACARAGIATGVHYPPPLHASAGARGHVAVSRDLRCAEAWAREELSLPMSPGARHRPRSRSLRRACAAAGGAAFERAEDDVCSPTPIARRRRVAVVGLGYWGPNLLRVLADDSDVDVRWICDRDRERLARFDRRYPAARPTTECTRTSSTDPRGGRGRHRHAGLHPLRARLGEPVGRQAHVRREAAGRRPPSSPTS